MDRLIKYLAELVYPHIKKQDWGSLGLPKNHQVDFDFRSDIGCYLELMGYQDNSSNYKSLKVMEFSTFKNGDWFTIKDFEEKIAELLKDNQFKKRDINRFFKWRFSE